ncbi:laccase domain-containing protein [Burkholderia stagnalis]|uniref:polyphenol oxidase family protein n=1 Tax=Burkholderia stagnalis TaxID=1503054 RepID=UPI000F5F7DFD|nr:polyphenol oxidase family protein [Burkholderia stagnalis]RQY11648.1 laccase domain-containing protein [Burkholderia stagnalis]
MHFDQIPRIRYGFGTSRDLVPPSLHALNADWPILVQTHGTRIVEVTDPAQPCGEADGMITRLPRVVLSVMTADCVPILFARRDGKRIAVLHAGWRGLLDGIVTRLAARIGNDDDVADWSALVGPSAGPCCYEVGDAFIEQFARTSGLPPELIAPPDRAHLDLPAIAGRLLADAGFHVAGQHTECTMCATTSGAPGGALRYNSYRRNVRAQPDAGTRTPVPNQLSGVVIL